MSRLDAVAAVQLFLSPPDVRRFGLRILRGRASPPNAESLWPELLAQHADIAILRTPAGGMRMSGFGLPLIHADTLVYWGARLDGRILPAQRNGNATVAPASGDDHAGVVRVATHAFAGYRSHYAANPLLARSAIDAGYAEWAGCLLSADPATHRTWVARLAGEVVGFASCRLDPATGMAEILLNAVHPDHAGCGIYSDLVRAAMLDASARGMRGVESSTQVWNHAVQKVWTRAGWGPLRSYDTWHINALLDAGAILAVLLILAAGGGAAVYFLVLKPKQGKKVPADLDDFDLEDEEEYLTEDEETEEKNE